MSEAKIARILASASGSRGASSWLFNMVQWLFQVVFLDPYHTSKRRHLFM